ncbi:MAG: autotransporter outer membrane beta-barrel domain-containing protein [Pseudomonadota bacterium]
MTHTLTTGTRVALLAVPALSVLAPTALAQQTTLSLDEAIAQQLAFNGGSPCAGLLNGDPDRIARFEGGLFDACTRVFSGQGTATPQNSSGGTSTAANVPNAVQSRMGAAIDEPAEEDKGAAEPRFAFFFTAGFQPFDRKDGVQQTGYDSTIGTLSGGVDYRFESGLVVGGALTATQQSGDFLAGGDFDVDTINVTGYAAQALGERAFVHAYVDVGTGAHSRTRRFVFEEADEFGSVDQIESTPSASFDSSEVNAGIALSYPFRFDNVSVGPVIAFDYSNVTFDEYAEFDDASGLALQFYETDEVSKLTSIGLEGSVAISTSWGVLNVQQNIFWRNESGRGAQVAQASFVNDLDSVRFDFLTDGEDEDYLEYSFGMTALLLNNTNVFLQYSAIGSHSAFDNRIFSAGFHKSF